MSSMGEGSGTASLFEAIEVSCERNLGEALCTDLFSNLQPLGYGRAPYAEGFSDRSHGFTIWAGSALPHFCIEISGQGCGYLYQLVEIDYMLMRGAEFLSRIDVAIDLEWDLIPEKFAERREGGRARTHANMKSQNGDTVYIGSMHSEHYCRVYRYAEPHPRAHLLRVEFVNRRQRAKVVGGQILLYGIESVARAMWEEAGFTDSIDSWTKVEPSDLSTFRPERNIGGTMRWLITQCAPAFKRLVQEGFISNPEQFLQSYFLEGLEQFLP